MDVLKILDIIYILTITINVIGIIFNLLLLAILIRLKTRRRSYFLLVKSLTIADLFQSFVFLTDAVLSKYLYPQKRDASYIVMYSVEAAQLYAICTVLCHLIMLAVEHFSAIMRPLYYVNWCRWRNIVWRLIIIWVLPLMEVLLAVVGMHTQYFFLMAYHTTIGMMYVCLLVICIVYVVIYNEVRKQKRRVSGLNREEKFRHKALSTTVFILLTFFVCWAPCMICWVISETVFVSYEVGLVLGYTTSNLTCLNCICDPLIYSLRLSKVRKIWRRSFQSCYKDPRIQN